MKLIGVDVGGTFTDVVLFDSETNETAVHKVPTTPDDPSRGVMQGVLELCASAGIDPERDHPRLHGTTIGTNAVLEYDGARRRHDHHRGYRDIVHIGRHQRPQHYSIMQEIPWQDRPLVRRRYRKVVDRAAGAAARRGAESRSTRTRCARPRASCDAEGVEAIAICFLFSYLNPAHEERARDDRARRVPGGFVTHLGRHRAAVPRVRALHHGGDERLYRAAGARLCRAGSTRRCARPASTPICTSCARMAAWRRRRRSPNAGADAAVGPGRRRARRRLDRARCRGRAQAHHLRRRRHQRRYRHRHRRPVRRGHGARYLDWRLSGASCR